MAETDPRKIGTGGLGGLKGLPSAEGLTDEEKALLSMDTHSLIKNVYRGGVHMNGYDLSSPIDLGGTYLEEYGKSQYDEPMMSMPTEEDVQENRYNNQSGLDVFANGVGKMLGTAGTTFISSLIGLPYGIGAAINQERWSAIWDNDVTNALSDADKWLEENMTNYQSQAQQQDPYFRFGDMNWWADNVIKNMGFTLGAAASMAVGSGSLGLMSKALGFVDKVGKGTKMANNFASALFSATGEGMIEAKKGVEERNKIEYARLEEALATEKQALEEEFNLINEEYEATKGQSLVRDGEGRLTDPAYILYKERMQALSQKKDELNRKMQAGRQQIEESGLEMGNKILLGNQILLTAGNLIQFGKTMSKSFDAARHAAQTSSKYAKPFGVSASRVSSNIADGYKIGGKNLGKTIAATKGIVTEGSEEMNQQWIQSASAADTNEKDVNDYWRATLDPEAYRKTTEGLYTLGNAISQGFKESWGDINQWEQFLIGGLTGAMGSYAPTKLFNQDKSKSVFNPMRYGEWSGGAINELNEFKTEYNKFEENIDDLNKVMASQEFPDRIKSMVGHTHTEEEKTQAVEAGDKKAFKDAEDKQIIHDIQAFHRAGKIDDLRAIYEEMAKDMSDEDVENIVKSTTREVTAEEDKQRHDAEVDLEIDNIISEMLVLQSEKGRIQTENNPAADRIDEIDDLVSNIVFTEIDDSSKEIKDVSSSPDTKGELKDNTTQWYDLMPEGESVKKSVMEKVIIPTVNIAMDSGLLNYGYDIIGETKKEKEEKARNAMHRLQKMGIGSPQELIQFVLDNKGKSIEKALIDSGREPLLSDQEKEELKKQKNDLLEEQASLRNYQFSPEVEQQLSDIDSKLQEKDKKREELLKKKREYTGTKHYESSYTDDRGARTKTDDEIREEVKHNAKELNRRLDSYLDSIDKINKETGGQLTKEQEDNLVYLHNLGKESLVRADKILAEKRKYLPQKLLFKTTKTPEQLAKETASSDLAFTKNENTKEGYVEVDTSLMNDSSFRDFLIRDILWGGNIAKEFGETAEDRAIREKEEADDKDLPKEERLARAKERSRKAFKKNVEAISQKFTDAVAQRDANIDLIRQAFVGNYIKENPTASIAETESAADEYMNDLQNIEALVSQAGDYNHKLSEYLSNPSKIDSDRQKEEKKNEKKTAENILKEKYGGKSAKDINQGIFNGEIDIPDLDGLASFGEVTDEDAKAAQQEILKAEKIRKKGAELKKHAQDNIGDNPTQDDLKNLEQVFSRIDNAVLAAENPEDMSLDMPELNTPIIDSETLPSMEELNAINASAQSLLSSAFDAMQADLDAQEILPDEVPSLDGVETPTTGHDSTTKTDPIVVDPKPSTPPDSKAAQKTPVAVNPLTPLSLNNIIEAVKNLYNKVTGNGVWRTTTTRNIYGSSTGTYHENIAKQQYGENSPEYKRSKAIWEFLNGEKAFDRLDDASESRIKPEDTIHFMVKYLPEVYGKDFNELTDEEIANSLVIIMLNDNGEVMGDLPLAQFEPSYRNGNPSSQVKDLLKLQEKLFVAFTENYKKNGTNEAVADSGVTRKGADNLNLTFNSARGKDKPLVSKVKQVMRGAVPFSTTERNTLNAVIGDGILELAIKTDRNPAATKRGKHDIDKGILVPSVGSLGQPYILMPTPSGEKIAIPFYTKNFDAKQHRNNEIYNFISGALYYLMKGDTLSKEQRQKYYQKHIDVLSGMLQVEPQDGTPKVIEIKGGKVYLHLQDISNPDNKINVVVDDTGDIHNNALALADALSGQKINVSLEYLNDNVEIGVEPSELYSKSYNKIIGEIADVNLPKDTQHTVNAWFTIELTTNAGTKPSKAVAPKVAGTMTETIGGRSVEIDVDNLIAKDPKTDTVIRGDEEVNLYLAKVRASQPMNQGKDFIQVTIDDEVRTYDVKKGKFVKEKKKEPQQKQDYPENPFFDGPLPESHPSTEGNPEGPGLNFRTGEPEKEKPQAPKAPETPKVAKKTIEEIEKEFKEKKIITRQNRDAWDAIPDVLKEMLYNKECDITLGYNGKFVAISMDNILLLSNVLKEANTAAKTGNLMAEQRPKHMQKDGITITRENQRKARQWLAKNLPMLSNEERTQFVEKLAGEGSNAGRAWGSYKNGVIQILRNAPEGTIYHEAFHYVMDMVLSPAEKAQILDLAKNEYGNMSDLEAEERLASDFRKFALDENAHGILGRLKRWFRKIMDRITRYNRISDDTINNLFWQINNGKFAQKAAIAENFEAKQRRIAREIREVHNNKYQWDNLSREDRKSLEDAGLTENVYSQMSLEEKMQYIRCRI